MSYKPDGSLFVYVGANKMEGVESLMNIMLAGQKQCLNRMFYYIYSTIYISIFKFIDTCQLKPP